jgi:hypothetical protein
MEKRYIFTDVDGVLLDMNVAYWEGVSKVVGNPVWGANLHWDYRQTAGLSREQEDEVWKHIWDTPLELYEAAESILDYLRKSKVSVIACSVRPEGPAKAAAGRDFPKLGIPYGCFETHEEKAKYIRKRRKGKTLYLEDKWDAADDMARFGIDTFLIDAPYNRSKDLDVKYKRVNRWEMPYEVRKWVRDE